jgi:hypothetical protein
MLFSKWHLICNHRTNDQFFFCKIVNLPYTVASHIFISCTKCDMVLLNILCIVTDAVVAVHAACLHLKYSFAVIYVTNIK